MIAQHGIGDAVDVGIRHAGGATSVISVSLTAPPGALGNEWRFYGTEETVTAPDAAVSAVDAFVSCVDDLLGAVRERRDTVCGVRFGREVVRVIAAAEAELTRRGSG